MANQTVVVQIGNTDDRLTQVEWAQYVGAVRSVITRDVVTRGGQIHFEGFAPADRRWQNACWVVALPTDFAFTDEVVRTLRHDLAWQAHRFRQDSVAWLTGVTEFVSYDQMEEALG